jgi:hypothetical protein
MYRLIHVTSVLLLSGFAFPANAEQAFPMLGTAVPEQTLSENRGGYTQFNTNNLNAELYNNQASYNITGTNSINSGTFANSSGFATVIQNSGNNVIIQNATILNLRLQ